MNTLFQRTLLPRTLSCLRRGNLVNKSLGRRHFTTPASDSNSSNKPLSMWQRYTAPKDMPPRGTFAWYREMALICIVFGITGSSTMMLVRPAVSDGLGIKGSILEGPWSYRICTFIIISPVYATLLVLVGTIFGRHAYFRQFSVKIFSRFGIPPELMDKNYHVNKKHFRKW
ncbi:hypothetical protein FisN_21Lh098 [Fistulifera solaris]|uniref:DUF6787 domain-containing protein n=1 Tax=Fistulifera solaris TaxID=1519565 RepID=A0A1Z5J8S9_FISSO|nr:hypothetical protein FisN_21Lh098 [Fistulifera solaris]|eukprot:GAX10403.1 hypothetical protein FisN_21Lh098 [Fistulifera solaris]